MKNRKKAKGIKASTTESREKLLNQKISSWSNKRDNNEETYSYEFVNFKFKI